MSIHTQETVKRISVPDIAGRKGKEPIVCLTAYDAPMAGLLDPHCDVLLVGDSLGMAVHGLPNTVGVTLEMMILHGQAVVRAEQELRAAQLWDKADKMSRTLSGGMKRRLMIARAMMTKPKLLILDEPTAGVDIEIRRGMWQTLKEINAAGTTIILTTHYLEEAESLCRNLAIIDRGVIVEQGPMRALLSKLDVEGFLLDVEGTLPELLPEIPGTEVRAMDAHTLDVDMPRAMDLNRVFATLDGAGIRVRSMRTKSNRLEELFVRMTGPNAAPQTETAA